VSTVISPHAAFLLQAEVGGELGDGRRFADARWSDQRHGLAAAGQQADRPTHAELFLHNLRRVTEQGVFVVGIERLGAALDRFQQLLSVNVGNAVIDQIGQQLEHCGRALRPAAAIGMAELIDERRTIVIELFAKARAKLISRRFGDLVFDRGHCLQAAGNIDFRRRCDLDLPAAEKTAEHARVDFASM
jgi:hypothetical protein